MATGSPACAAIHAARPAVVTCAASSAGSRAGSPRAMPHSVAMPSTRDVPPRGRQAGRIACGVVVMDEAEIELRLRASCKPLERGEIGIVRARLGHRHVEELDRPSDAGDDGVGHLDHDRRCPSAAPGARRRGCRSTGDSRARSPRARRRRSPLSTSIVSVRKSTGPWFVVALPGRAPPGTRPIAARCGRSAWLRRSLRPRR